MSLPNTAQVWWIPSLHPTLFFLQTQKKLINFLGNLTIKKYPTLLFLQKKILKKNWNLTIRKMTTSYENYMKAFIIS
jgi:hypothetical protein